MTTETDALILRYLQELEAQLQNLPADRRRELLDEVGDHIAAEARERFGVQLPPARPATPRLEVAAVVLLAIPFLGWVVGVALVWVSRLWTTRDKLIGTIGGLSWVWAGLGTIMVQRPSTPVAATGIGEAPAGPAGSTPLEVVLVVLPFVLPLVAAVYLGIRLRRRAAA